MTKGLQTIAQEEQEIRARLKTRTTAITNARLALERQEQEQAEDLAKLDALARDASEAFAQTRAIADGPLAAAEAETKPDEAGPAPPPADGQYVNTNNALLGAGLNQALNQALNTSAWPAGRF